MKGVGGEKESWFALKSFFFFLTKAYGIWEALCVYIVCACVCIRVHVCVRSWHGACVEVRG